MAQAILFYVFGGVAVAASFLAVTRRNPVTAGLLVALALFAMAGLFALLSAHFIAVIQILVYAGAIIVLFIFVIMLLNLGEEDLRDLGLRPWPFMVVWALLAFLLAGLIGAVRDVGPGLGAAELAPDFGTIAATGQELFTRYLVPFEAISVLLLAAIVGAVVLATKRY